MARSQILRLKNELLENDYDATFIYEPLPVINSNNVQEKWRYLIIDESSISMQYSVYMLLPRIKELQSLNALLEQSSTQKIVFHCLKRKPEQIQLQCTVIIQRNNTEEIPKDILVDIPQKNTSGFLGIFWKFTAKEKIPGFRLCTGEQKIGLYSQYPLYFISSLESNNRQYITMKLPLTTVENKEITNPNIEDLQVEHTYIEDIYIPQLSEQH